MKDLIYKTIQGATLGALCSSVTVLTVYLYEKIKNK